MANLSLILAICCCFYLGKLSLAQGINITGPGMVHVVENSPAGSTVAMFLVQSANPVSFTLSGVSSSDFSISENGQVSVANPPDRETKSTYALTVTASSDSDMVAKTVTIVILDMNDNSPTFENAPMNNVSIALSESEPVGAVVYTVFASDPDQGSSGNFHFVLTDPDDLFTIGYLTGNIELHQSLDHESNTEHTLTVSIVDEGAPSLTTTVTITVSVTNTIDQAPTFTKKLYFATTPEGVYSMMSPVFLTTIRAIDADQDPSAVIKYFIVQNGQPWIGQFSVNEDTGAVMVSGTIDFESMSRFVVPVQAREYTPGGTQPIDAPPASSTVVVSITDVNDNSPVFLLDVYTGVVPEDADIGSIVIASVAAFDHDQGSNGAFLYLIQDRSINIGDAFNINNNTGVIFVTGSLDHEVRPSYTFSIEAVDMGTVPLTGTASVSIQVQDTNDHPPVFIMSNFTFSILENEPSTTFTQPMEATDVDNVAIVYTLAGQGSGTSFSLSTTGNQAFLTTTSPLDREDVASYHMLLLASDGDINSLTATANVFVNVGDRNDNSPEFDVNNYSADLVEETTYLSNCFSVHAVDDKDLPGPNSDIVYSFTVASSNPNTDTTRAAEFFAVDTTTGQFSCSPINHEENFHTITIIAVATDEGTDPGPQSGTATVQITIEDINEHVPVFSSPTYTATILETHTVGTQIGLTVTATESGDIGLNHAITYTITSGNIGGAFAVNETSGEITLANAVDYETLTLGNNPILFTVRAVDQPDSMGTIQSSFATVMVTIEDVNDNTPTFPSDTISLTLSEGAPTGVVHVFQAVDNDGPSDGLVQYTFNPSPPFGVFTLGLTSGVLTLITPPDREALPTSSANTFTFAITARDSPSDPSLARMGSVSVSITVADINDNSPSFNTSLFTSPIQVLESVSEGAEILSMPATDPDEGSNKDISYAIESVSPLLGLTKFNIDTAGVLRAGISEFDYENSGERAFTIVVIARDMGTVPMQRTGTATVNIELIDVNDETPLFSAPAYYVTINETNGGAVSSSNISIGAVAATDSDDPFSADSRITFKIEDNRAKGWFGVDSNTGELLIVAGQEVDREAAQVLIDSAGRGVVTFDILAADGGSPSLTGTAEVTVYIQDVNDNSPVFAVDVISTGVPESSVPGTLVEVVSATDLDYGTNAVVSYYKTSGDTENLFNISDPRSGRVVVSGYLDKEAGTPGMHHIVSFVITASDNAGNNDMVQVMVEITDSNDNSPVFNNTFYQTSISENATFDQAVEFVFATDADTGSNGDITYAIVGGNINNAFYLKHPTTQGNIRVNNAKAIDRETTPFYRLIVTATDNAFPDTYRRMAVAECVVVITDINDNTPTFLYPSYIGSVPESSPINTTVIVSPALLAMDDDTGTNAEITYHLPSGDEFQINPQTGFITTFMSSLDREERDVYNIMVQARDGGGRVGLAQLIITVTDVNDKAPVIIAESQNLDLDRTVPENLPVGEHIVDVVATDDDIGVNAQLTYSVTGGGGYFLINGSGAILLSQSMLPTEGLGPFELLVTVTDGGIPALSNSFEVDVTISDINDNAPGIIQFPNTVHILEDLSIGSVITDSLLPIKARDIDEGVNAEIEYLINPSTVFAIDLDSGQINLTAKLDREVLDQHTISVVARDKGSPQMSSNPVTITFIVGDVNDNAPVFTQNLYAANVSENTVSGVPLLLLAAADNDTGTNGVIQFELTGPTPNSLIRVDAQTGLVLTNMEVDSTFSNQWYNYVVVAKDQGVPQNSDTATIMIHVTSDGEVQFNQSSYSFTIVENLPAGTVVGKVEAIDPDPVMNPNSVIYFSLLSNQGDTGPFSINSTNGVITLLEPLDREDQSLHLLTIIAQNQGDLMFQHANYTTVTVIVIDVNDNSPKFELNSFSTSYDIREDISRNTTIATLQATDSDIFPNNRIVFDILSDPRTLFKIDHETGLLQTEVGHGSDGFDFEQFTQYFIEVIVYNGAEARDKNSTVTITFYIIDVNDETPYFIAVPSSVCVNESAPGGSVVITIMANDSDAGLNGRVHFGIADDGNNIGDAFSIGSLSGNLMVLNPLDYDSSIRNYVLNITIHDSGFPQRSNSRLIYICVLDVNDNSPTFSAPIISVMVPENSPMGTQLHTFVITDIDSSPYNESVVTIESGNHDGILYLNSTDKALYVNNTDQLDFESGNPTYAFVVRATDALPGVNGNSLVTTATVSLTLTDVNDNSPVFDEPVYNVSLLERTALNTIIERVIATDQDTGSNAELEYAFISGNIEETFSINPSDGTITLAKTLDHENGPTSYTIIVIVRNIYLNDTATLYVTVINENDHKPVFIMPPSSPIILTVNENSSVGYQVYKVQAVDGDGDTVTYSLSNIQQNDFTINATSGLITLTSTLDRETQKTESFTVLAKDSGNLTSSAAFIIDVEDANDNKPFFRQNSLNEYVSEDTFVGIDNPLMTITGDDEDGSDALCYYLVVNDYVVSGSCASDYCIENTSGRLYFNKALDREKQDLYNITIAITNCYPIPTNESVASLCLNTLNLTLTVTDVNDNSPQFEVFTTKAGVAQDAAYGSVVSIVVATDRDTGSNAVVWYELTVGVNRYPFVIDKKTGQITTAGVFKDLVGMQYVINVEAFDHEGMPPSLRNMTTINVWVYDYLEHILILTVNRTSNDVASDRARYFHVLEVVTDGQVVITEVRVQTSDLGSIDKSGSDVLFLVVHKNGDLLNNRYALVLIESMSQTLMNLIGNENPQIRLPARVDEVIPIWFWVIIAVLVVIILLLCCAFCVFIIVEKRINRKLRQEVLESSYSNMSQSMTTTTNPMWIPPPVIVPDDDIPSISSISTKELVEKPNPVYEEQEVVMELFMDDDTDEPPLGSTENLLLPPGYHDSVNTHDLLVEAVGLSSDDDEEDYTSEI